MLTKPQFLIGPLVVAVAAMLTFSGIANGLEPPSQAEREESASILTGIVRERETLRTGRVTMSGTRTGRGAERSERTSPIDSLFVFDFDQNLWRYDTAEIAFNYYIKGEVPSLKIVATSLKEIPEFADLRQVRAVNNAEYHVAWLPPSRPQSHADIALQLPRPLNNFRPSGAMTAFDPRSAGLLGDMRGIDSVSKICETLNNLPLTGFARSGDGVVLLTFANAGMRLDLKIDTSDGYRPLSRVMVNQPGVGVPFRKESTAEWKRVNGVNVPVKIAFREEIFDEESGVAEFELDLNWQSVNEPVDVKWFDYRSFPDVPQNRTVAVVDVRVKTPIHLGVLDRNWTLAPDPRLLPPQAK